MFVAEDELLQYIWQMHRLDQCFVLNIIVACCAGIVAQLLPLRQPSAGLPVRRRRRCCGMRTTLQRSTGGRTRCAVLCPGTETHIRCDPQLKRTGKLRGWEPIRAVLALDVSDCDASSCVVC